MTDKVEQDQSNEKPDEIQSSAEAKSEQANDGAERDQYTGQVTREQPGFDWVSERSACTLPKVFSELRSQVEADVKIRNGLRPNYAPYEFSVAQKGADFSVVLAAKDVRKSVTFSLAEHAILVRDHEGNQMFEVTVTFDDQGKCRLNVHGNDRELWQVRRMALEDLMFPRN